MESEPAFFNVMLKDMGVKDVTVQEVIDLDESFLLNLPSPVHALIFLFRYRETETSQSEGGKCPKEVWFANQTPDFACATFALLNIVNNIPGLELGDELRRFKEFTADMDPLSRGDAIDGFDFVKHIHNSFARENDLLQADIVMQNKNARYKKQRAVAKAVATKAAKKAASDECSTAPLQEKSANVKAPERASMRQKKPTSRKSPKESTPPEDDDDGDYAVSKKGRKSDSKSLPKEQPNGVRRSGRAPQPRKDVTSAVVEEPPDEEGFHFIAFMPINGHVWKLDGLDRFPQDVGAIDESTMLGWMQIAQDQLRGRMLQYEASEIQFNLMSVVHDSLSSRRVALIENIKGIQTIDKQLKALCEGWQELDGAETSMDTITSASNELDIEAKDVDAAKILASTASCIEQHDGLPELLKLRQDIISQQAPLRGSVRESLAASKQDDEKARHRRHDYGAFVRKWAEALADNEMLNALAEQ